jgi:hypothetical protein
LPDRPGATASGSTIAAEADNDVEMDGGPVKDGGMDSRGQPALPPDKQTCVNARTFLGSKFKPAFGQKSRGENL